MGGQESRLLSFRISPKPGCILTRRFASFLPPHLAPLACPLLTPNTVSALDIDYICMQLISAKCSIRLSALCKAYYPLSSISFFLEVIILWKSVHDQRQRNLLCKGSDRLQRPLKKKPPGTSMYQGGHGEPALWDRFCHHYGLSWL